MTATPPGPVLPAAGAFGHPPGRSPEGMTAAPEPVVGLPTLDALRGYVHKLLCDLDHLDPAAAPLCGTPLLRGKEACGLLFHVAGPRLLRTAAVWAADEARLLVYDSTGRRVRQVRLCESPDPAGILSHTG